MKYPIHSLRTIGCAASIAALAAIPARASMPVMADSNAAVTVLDGRTVFSFTQNGTLTVTDATEVEVLIVGGGGGGGRFASGSDASVRSGGGGGGGVIHRMAFTLQPGNYPIVIGSGGAVNNSDNYALAQGGDTTAFGLTAKGGGYGARALSNDSAGSGASGGGNARRDWSGNNNAAGSAIYTGEPYENLGHDGGSAVSIYGGGGGGGGAGTAAVGAHGGDGYPCSITGEEIYYAGGGGGDYKTTAGLGADADSPGGGGSSNYAGGNGIVIVSVPMDFLEAFDDATGGVRRKTSNGDELYWTHSFTENGTFSITEPGTIEVLLVGGGGGGGRYAPGQDSSAMGGGGGGGGVVHVTTLRLLPGDYPVVIGAGGAVNTNYNHDTAKGGDTTAFGLTAMGGGYGSMALVDNPAGNGASGGGSARKDWNGNNSTFGRAVYTGAPWNNLGHDGGAGVSIYAGGGGGGGGGGAGSAGSGNRGGDGYPCDISGILTYYGGGGGGNGDATNGLGGGTNSVGGGGRSNSAGGSGIVIVRYGRKRLGTVIAIH